MIISIIISATILTPGAGGGPSNISTNDNNIKYNNDTTTI